MAPPLAFAGPPLWPFIPEIRHAPWAHTGGQPPSQVLQCGCCTFLSPPGAACLRYVRSRFASRLGSFFRTWAFSAAWDADSIARRIPRRRKSFVRKGAVDRAATCDPHEARLAVDRERTRGGGREPGARSQEPGARSRRREREARSREPGVRSRGLGKALRANQEQGAQARRAEGDPGTEGEQASEPGPGGPGDASREPGAAGRREPRRQPSQYASFTMTTSSAARPRQIGDSEKSALLPGATVKAGVCARE